MVVDKDFQLFRRIGDSFDALFKPLEHPAETVVLNEKQELFLRLAVVIEPGETHSRLARNIAHRGRVITLLGKDPRRSAQNQFKLFVVAAEIVVHSFEREKQLAADKRGFARSKQENSDELS